MTEEGVSERYIHPDRKAAAEMVADANERAGFSTITPAEVGGLWVPAKPEHAKIGWTYDFEQTERIARAAYDSTGYDATMEVVEFVMAEADRRAATALRLSAGGGWGEPVAYRVHDFHVARAPVKARGKFEEPTEYFYPAGREKDAREVARIMGATCTPLYALPAAPTVEVGHVE